MGTKTIYNRFHQWVALQPKATAVAEDGRPATYQGYGKCHNGKILQQTVFNNRIGDES